MRIGVISDTHGEISATQNAVRMFDSFQVDLVIHCGDVDTPAIVQQLADRPCHFVLGNMDNRVAMPKVIEAAGQTCHDRFGHLQLEGRSIAFLHGHDLALLRGTINSGRWDLVCCGHTHVAAQQLRGRTLVVNPGAIQRTNTPSVAVIDLPSLEVTTIAL
ncbi:MAG: YfcE family phosphodiesterase [Candidatus Nealsonbacteria bacterium]|nr:YfcE family phosphodiesterase [Candidatus Nealsonbacteria bacterium]